VSETLKAMADAREVVENSAMYIHVAENILNNVPVLYNVSMSLRTVHAYVGSDMLTGNVASVATDCQPCACASSAIQQIER
jgi:hypothetical protein